MDLDTLRERVMIELRNAPKKKCQRITALKVHEVSLVDTPAVPGAKIVVMKRWSDSPPRAEAGLSVAETALAKVLRVLPNSLVPALQEIATEGEYAAILKVAKWDAAGLVE
jgi:hypothetical protein